MQNEDGVSELVDETLLIALVVICAGIAGVLFLGFVIPVEKTAYLVPQFGLKDNAGSTVITIFDRGGDPLYFDGNPAAKYRGAVYIDTAIGSFLALREPTLTSIQPGDMVYVYYDGSDFIITDDLTGSPVTGLPAGGLAIRIVDSTSNVLIAGETLIPGAVTTGMVTTSATTPPTTTVSPSATMTTTSVTGTSTLTPTATVTTATPTPTATTLPSTYGITVSWSPNGISDAVYQPSTPVLNGQVINVPAGSSPSFSFIPHNKKYVAWVKLDGRTVYTGSAVNSPVSVTIPSVAGAHTLTAFITQ